MIKSKQIGHTFSDYLMLCDLKHLNDEYYFSDIFSIIHENMKEIQCGETVKLIKISEYSLCN